MEGRNSHIYHNTLACNYTGLKTGTDSTNHSFQAHYEITAIVAIKPHDKAAMLN